MTGQFPSRWGVHQHFAAHDLNVERNMPDWLDPKAPLLPRVLQAMRAIAPHIIGKWHLSGGGIDDAPVAGRLWLRRRGGVDRTGPACVRWHGAPGSPVARRRLMTRKPPRGSASRRPIMRLKFIRQSQGAPFYVNLWLHETHHLVSATDEDKQPYPDIAEPHRTYYAAVTRADRQVGRILDVLDELGDRPAARSSSSPATTVPRTVMPSRARSSTTAKVARADCGAANAAC